MQHRWITSTLGHGNMMCAKCYITDLEANAIGRYSCEPAEPKLRPALPDGHTATILPFKRKED